MDQFNQMPQQDQQQRQEAAIEEYRCALKVLTTIGPKMKELGLKTVSIAGMQFKLPVDEPLRRAHLLLQLENKAKGVVRCYMVDERDLFPDAD